MKLAKVGRVLSGANEKALRQAMDTINGVLAKLGMPEAAPMAKADVQTGVMVALYPTAAVAQALAQPDGEPAPDLHVTLAYLGETTPDLDVQKLATVIAGVAASSPPLAGTVSGVGRFTGGPEPVTYASVDVPCLTEMREDLCDALYGAGFEPSAEHGFQPHLTLAYDDRALSLPPTPLSFDALTLAVAGQRQAFALAGVADDTLDAIYQMERIVPVWKDAPRQVVYGVVLQPGVTDSQGDRVSAQEIEQAAHRYLTESRKSDVQHDESQAPVEVVESYIAPADLEVAGHTVLKGSWVMATHISDPALWAAVEKRQLTGYSIGGTALRA